MKLRRSKSPFAKRRTVQSLLDDVRQAGNALSSGTVKSEGNNTEQITQSSSISSTKSVPAQKHFDDERRHNWSQSQYEQHGKQTSSEDRDSEGEHRRNWNESERAKQIKTAELIQRTRRMVRNRMEKQQARSTSTGTSLATPDKASTVSSMGSGATFEKKLVARLFARHKSTGNLFEPAKEVTESPRKSRSKSPFRRWRKAEDLIDDIRQKEANSPQTPSTAASSESLQCRDFAAEAGAAVTPPSTNSPLIRSPSPESSRGRRSKSSFRHPRKSGELVHNIKLLEQDFAFELQRNSTGLLDQLGRRSPVASVRLHNKASEPIQPPTEVEVVWSPPSRSARNALHPKSLTTPPREVMPTKGKETKAVEVILESPPPPVKSLTLKMPKHRPKAPTKEKTATHAPVAKLGDDMPERKTVYNSFTESATPSALVQHKVRQEAAAVETPHQRRPSLFGRKTGGTVSGNIASEEEVAQHLLYGRSVPQSIKCNLTTVSELSNPVFVGGRHRSISFDSAIKLKKALSKVRSNVNPYSPSSKGVQAVVETLLKVTDKLESQADRETILEALNGLGNDIPYESSASQAASVSSRSHSRLAKADDETDIDSGNNDDASSFARWEMMDRAVQRILGMIGLSYFWRDTDTVDEEGEDDYSSSSSSWDGSTDRSTDETNRTGQTSVSSFPTSATGTQRRKLLDDELTQNLIMDDADMLRELEELDRKTKLEAERDKRKKLEADRTQKESGEEKQDRLEKEKSKQSKNQKDATLKARLERRRLRRIIIAEEKARDEDARRQLSMVENEKLRNEAAAAEEEERKRIARKLAEEFAMRQEQAAAEAEKKKRIRLEQIKEAARRREAEEQRQKLQQQKAEETARQREAHQKKRHDEEAKVRRLQGKNDKARLTELDTRRHTKKSNVTTSSDDSTDSDSYVFPLPPKWDRLSQASTSFHPVRENGTTFHPVQKSGSTSRAESFSVSDSRPISPFWSDGLSLGSLDSSQFDVPPTTKKGKEERRGYSR